MTIYIVNNYDTGEFEAFKELEQAATYVRKYYRDHMASWYGDSDTNVEYFLQSVKADLENLESNYPYIEDIMYINSATLHD